MAQFETVSGVALALWPGALGFWAVQQVVPHHKGTVHFPKLSPPAGSQCVGRGGWELTPRPPWVGPDISAFKSLGRPGASLRGRE